MSKKEAVLSKERIEQMEARIAGISLTTGECIRYDFPYYGPEGEVLIDLHGDTYEGQLELKDEDWREWEKAVWCAVYPFDKEV